MSKRRRTMGIEIPSARPPPDSEPPDRPPTESERVSQLLRENASLRDQRQRYKNILEDRRMQSIAAPAAKTSQTIPQWAAVLVAIIGAIGATGGWEVFQSIREKPTARPEELQRVESKCEERFDALATYLAGYAEDQKRRDEIQNTVMAELNGGAIASGVEYTDDACEPRALSKGKIVPGQPICKAKKPWPTRRRPPKPTEDE